uniref:Uncharacterized protein n=1 Tax=Anguilla anguilla TaxID=7936 RepID=A0A0E9PNS2_ANGAN
MPKVLICFLSERLQAHSNHEWMERFYGKPCISHIFYLTITTGIIPKPWKTACVLPLDKASERT